VRCAWRVLIAGVLIAGVLIAGVLIAGVLIAGVLIAKLKISSAKDIVISVTQSESQSRTLYAHHGSEDHGHMEEVKYNYIELNSYR